MASSAQSGPYLLDTTTWLRVFSRPQELPERVRTTINTQKVLFLSWISLWQVRDLAAKGRLKLPVPLPKWLQLSTPPERVKLVDLTDEIAGDSAKLPGDLQAEPAERILVATARCRGLTLLTADEKILNYPHVQAVDAR